MLATILRSPTLMGRPPAVVVEDARANEVTHVAAQIAVMHAECFSRGWGEHEIETLMDRPGVSVMLARAEGRGRDAPLGFLILRRDGHGPEAEAEIVTVGVPPRARRRGVGDRLMRAAIRECQADRIGRLVLEVDGANRGAVALYRRLGFRQVGERRGYYRDADATTETPPSDALVMALDLR